MKIIWLVICALIIVGCNSNSNKKESKEEIKKEEHVSNSKEASTNGKLSQNGDYSSLFSSPLKECGFITEKDVAVALDISSQNVIAKNQSGHCKFDTVLSDGSNWTVTLRIVEMDKKAISNEIENYTDENTPLSAQLSKTGDTYLCIHPYNGWLFLYNDHYDATVLINYGSMAASRMLTTEQKEERKQLALKLGDYLLLKHKK